ncbi:centriole proteome protein [Phlyctochytrium arcticum]|nr:centriole proteome protein [Phlyctochytrium arcticum]
MAATSDILKTTSPTPEMVLKFGKPTDKFLCPLSINRYIEFLEFRIRDMASNTVVFDVQRPGAEIDWEHRDQNIGDEIRSVAYTFPSDFLRFESVGTTLVFAVCPAGIQKLRMVERHYFKGKLLKSFDFTFGYCIPNSVNTWEAVYELPKLDDKQIKDMIDSPGETLSDSFYFVDDELVMHNKASYTYV